MYKVMIVDDEPYVREGLKAIIEWERYGFQICYESENGIDAINKVKQERPDLVIADIKMPRMNGLDMIKYCREMLGVHAQYILLTGYGEFEYARQAIRLGVARYLLKPVDEDELIEALADIAREIKRQRKDNVINVNKTVYTVSEETVCSDDIMDRVEEYIRNHFNEDLNLKSIADRFYVNSVYLGQLFRKHFGLYFKDYLHRLRMEEAKKLLKGTELKVYEIAAAVGYSDPNYFVSKFKKITQYTPLEYREHVL